MDIIGIDLGTTNSVATVMEGDALQHILFDDDFLLPSVVNISDNGVIVGVKAKNMALIESENTAISIKRKMGSDEKIILNNTPYTPAEISSFIIKRIKEEATKQIGREFKRAVVTVPAYFNEKQREDTAKAVRLAGLEPIRILNEPTAAAISYGANRDEDMVYAIYDLGGGTFDISIIENSKGLLEVVSTTGDNHLGGDDFDQKLADFILQKSGLKLDLTNKIKLKLLKIAQDTKVKLSSQDEVVIDEKFFAKQDGKALHLEVTITKEEFEDLIEADIDKTVELLEEAVEESGYSMEEIDAIILTGGSSRIPLISKKILEKTSKLPILIEDPDKSVSIGAILQAAMIEGKDTDSILIDITPYSLGTSTLDPLSGNLILSKIILKNSPVPIKKTSRYYAVAPFQEAFEVTVYQGENEYNLEENVKIGEMLLKVKNPVEDGALDITFALDQNGILNVNAVEIHTNEEIQGEFKTTISKASNHNKVKDMQIVDSHMESIINKIDALLASEEILEEDKADLKKLKSQYINAKDEKEKKELEEEIIDTIFFLEE